MEIDKKQIMDLLKNRGEQDKATQAESDLPDTVDTEKHADNLGKLGVNPQDLLGGLSGKIGL